MCCSRIATGYMKAEDLDKFSDDNGTSFQEAASAAGYVKGSSQAQSPSADPVFLSVSLVNPLKTVL